MHHFAQTSDLDFGLEQSYSAAKAYNNAKLYTIWLAIAQAEALEKQGSSVTVNAYHPGLIATNLGNDGVKTQPEKSNSYQSDETIFQGFGPGD